MEDVEVPDGDPADVEFQWEMNAIFNESSPTENVILAQPLSTKFDMTPVPLINVGSTASVSRYARTDNIKEFIRPIRSQPQWSYLQEDPAFADTKTDGELIPLNNVAEWMAIRQGTDSSILSHRKRGRSKFEHDSPVLKTEMELSMLSAHKEETLFTSEDNDAGREIVDAPVAPDHGTSHNVSTPPARPVTPTLELPGTPSLQTEDDVWAPQPGEGAVSTLAEEDPTEAILASLGVTGSPKPVRKRSIPRLFISTDETSSRKRTKTAPAEGLPGYANQHISTQPDHNYQAAPNNNSALDAGQPHTNLPRPKMVANDLGVDNRQYNSPQQSSYVNDLSPSNGSPLNNGPYSAISPHSQRPNDHHRPNTHGGPQTPGALRTSKNGFSQKIPGPPQFHDPWAASHQSNTYGKQPYGNNGNTTNTASEHEQHRSGALKAADRTNIAPIQNGSPDASMPRSHLHDNHGGYLAGRKSDGGKQSNDLHHLDSLQGQIDDDGNTPSSPTKTPVFSEGPNNKSSDDPEESPLTPTSAEILGKLTQPTRQNSGDRRSDETMKRPRRPQPIVAEAYR